MPPSRPSRLHRSGVKVLALATALAPLAACTPADGQQATGHDASAEVAASLAEPHEHAARQAEAQRLADLWAYTSVAVPGEAVRQNAASLRNQRPDEDDTGSFAVVPTVQMVLRSDPRWGQSVYLVIEDGQFDCGKPCAFRLRFDQAEPLRFAGEASSTGTRPALFIKDDVRFIEALKAAGRVEIAPENQRHAPLVFETGGFQPLRYARGT